MKVLVFVIWILVLIVAVYMVGWWTLAPGIGIPLFCGLLYIWPDLKEAYLDATGPDHSIGTLNKVRRLVKNEKVTTDETYTMAKEAATAMGIVVDANHGKLGKSMSRFSAEYMGKFLAHLLVSDMYTDETFKQIAACIKKDRPKAVAAVLSQMRQVNQAAAEKIEQYI